MVSISTLVQLESIHDIREPVNMCLCVKFEESTTFFQEAIKFLLRLERVTVGHF